MNSTRQANALNRWHKCTSQKGLDKLLAYFGGSLSGREIMVMEFYDHKSIDTVYLRLAVECGLWQYAMLCIELTEVSTLDVSKDFKDKTISRLQLMHADGLFEFRNGSDVIRAGCLKWRFLSPDD